jgi:hypothetical protein
VQWLGAALVVLAVVVVSGGLRRAHRSG